MAYTWQVRSWWNDYLGVAPPWVKFLGRSVRVAVPLQPALQAMEFVLHHHGYGDADIVGSYFNRNIAGSSKKSTHAYGVAVDVDPYAAGNPHFKGAPWTYADIKFTPEQVAAIKAIRNTSGSPIWRWLGDVNGDTMHWQVNVPPWRVDVDWGSVDGFNRKDSFVLELGKALLAIWSEEDLRAFHALGLWHASGGNVEAGVDYFKGAPADVDIINLLVAVLSAAPQVLVAVESSTPNGLAARVDNISAQVGGIVRALRSV